MTSICTIICDDVRREQSGKFIFVGVYDSEIIIKEKAWERGPVSLPQLCFVVSVRDFEPGEKTVEVWLSDPKGQLHTMEEKITMPHTFRGLSNTLVFTVGGITFPEPGDYCFHFAMEGQNEHQTKFRVSSGNIEE